MKKGKTTIIDYPELSYPNQENSLGAENHAQYGMLQETTTVIDSKPLFTFIDLFAGIGGFRIAMQNLKGKCVFSSEWDKKAQETYYLNFGEFPFGDITLKETQIGIPNNFDLLCAGFPCQPFSKGGFQNGFNDIRGTLFFEICKIVSLVKPKFLFLENVQNLVTHDNGNTYKVICEHLNTLNYYFPEQPLIISPDKFGIPVMRPRLYIPCVRKDIALEKESKIINFQKYFYTEKKYELQHIDAYLDVNTKNNLSEYELNVICMWDEFYKGIDIRIIGFPIWSEYFNTSSISDDLPNWKKEFINKNQQLYSRNKKFIDKWLKKHNYLEWVNPTHRKMEWQAGDKFESAFDCLIQFRPSGVRIKKPDKFSTLVAMNHQQIIGKLRRKITVEESKLLQSFPQNFKLHPNNAIALKQLGNSVNITVVSQIAGYMIKHYA